MTRRDHRFTWTVRPGSHIHRITPTCHCGWIGVHRRSVDAAREEWAIHERQADQRTRRRGETQGSNWQPSTEAAELPEALR